MDLHHNVEHVVFQLSADCKYKSTDAVLLVGSEEFTWSGSTPDSPGYTAIYTWHAIQRDESPAQFEKGQVWEIHQVYSVMQDSLLD